MHHLVRAYAATEQARLSPQYSTRAQLRLFEYYARTARAAAHLNPTAGGDKKRFPDRGAAMAWFDAERANLVAAVHTAHATGHPDTTITLASLLANYLNSRRHLQDALAVATLAHDAATSLGDRHREATAWNNLGTALGELRRFDDARDTHQHALDIYQDLGDRHREAMAWNSLGTAWRGAEAYGRAVEAGGRSAEVFRESEDAYREGEALGELAATLPAAGRTPGEIRSRPIPAAAPGVAPRRRGTRRTPPHMGASRRGRAGGGVPAGPARRGLPRGAGPVGGRGGRGGPGPVSGHGEQRGGSAGDASTVDPAKGGSKEGQGLQHPRPTLCRDLAQRHRRRASVLSADGPGVPLVRPKRP
ncbi:hypothetical protein GCM10018781_64350 [Kitasatospora indigofera]|uniref:Tetratricopeptide repeat protein n=1 Tax=Kitasatospora indigofera TaxID=67307 RepID=A0A919GCJ5_9ACTN|nr:tetratricopeptide repeat protein [Kitasatospora indigofera]GHH81526.1 hypothetical protein GCM10018781_64350 [Kitasatospora indigofera]